MIVRHNTGTLLEVKQEYGNLIAGYLLNEKRQRVIVPREKRIGFTPYAIRIVAIRDCTEVPTTMQLRLFE